VRPQRIRREPRRLSFNYTVFGVAAGVLLGRALYFSVASVIGFGTFPFHMEFNGYVIHYGYVLDALGMLVLAAVVVVVVLLVAYARRRMQQAPVEADVETCACPDCLSLIPATARRCAHCRSHVEPQAAPEDTSA